MQVIELALGPLGKYKIRASNFQMLRYNMTDGQKKHALHFIHTLKEANMCDHCAVCWALIP